MSEEEKKAIDFLKIFSKTEIDYCKLEKADVLDILNVIDKQQKEIEELKRENFDTVYIQAIENYKDKIREKIKELNNKNINADGISAIFNITKIQTLEELLEE